MEQKTAFESLVGDFLQQLGYSLTSETRRDFRSVRLRTTYLPIFEAKRWIRDNTPLGRLVRLDRLEIEPERSPSVILWEGRKKASD